VVITENDNRLLEESELNKENYDYIDMNFNEDDLIYVEEPPTSNELRNKPPHSTTSHVNQISPPKKTVTISLPSNKSSSLSTRKTSLPSHSVSNENYLNEEDLFPMSPIFDVIVR